ncbi:tetratricopeptide repeat protein [Lentzea tibetensis]|uniref:Tetratricopeptide repeat protein n=1 Tax=Lentzea tibetensis TaxID=2591470 RepID=A0A563EJW8_9PSEU|nr:BTAD domain-containing putative transcriptional regulator [Lentzea tibetensis]TWP46976.1 tetratricopeptide repeat protein [Lentzea tibetensis]
MRIRLLGPIDVVVDGAPRPVRGLRRKAVLAVLALQHGHIVSVPRLADCVWSDNGQAAAVNTLQSHVSHLRQVLGHKTSIVARPPGYVLDLGSGDTDVEDAERLIRQGMRSDDSAAAARQLRSALELWRGSPLEDVAGLAWLDGQAERLNQLRSQAVRALLGVRLELGEHAALVRDLERLAAEHPLDEQVHAQLMLALYRSGRQADALDVYRRLRCTLADNLGIDPTLALRELEARVLRQDPGLSPAPRTAPLTVTPQPPPVSAPAQLPLEVRGFAGREPQLKDLDALLAQVNGPSPTALVAVLSGSAGVGKTALAVHWARRVAGEFPDGQLYVNLRGYDPSGLVTSSADAVRGFLDALGVPPQGIPVGADAQAALFRSLLAERRMLIVVDNARDAGQVRPLLPGAPGCLVVVTSRDQLSSLVGVEGAYPLTLGVLTDDETRQLLAFRLGADRIAAEPRAADEIGTRCARLPLALVVVAARAATHPLFSLRELAAELGDSRERLDALAGGDPAADVRAVFSWSYRTLTPEAARVFRLLGLHQGPDVSLAAAASLAGLPVREARHLLGELARAHLIVEHVPARYAFHDLLRAYAAELAQHTDSTVQRTAALRRTLDHYLHTAHRAAVVLHPHRDPIELPPLDPRVTPESLDNHHLAVVWFSKEHAVLIAALHQAARHGFDRHTWALAWTLHTYFNRRGHWHDWAAVWQVGVEAATRLADPRARAIAHRGLSWAHVLLTRFDEATVQLLHALELWAEVGDLLGQADVHLDLGRGMALQGRFAEARHHARQALELYESVDHRGGLAFALNNVGMAHIELGDHERGLACCRESLALHKEVGNRDGEAGAWDSVGYAYHHLGDHAGAIHGYQHALDLYRDLGDRYEVAATLRNLGDSKHSAGDVAGALGAWRESLSILDDLAHPDADRLRAKLRSTA